MEEAGAPVYNYYMPDRALYERILAAARSRLDEPTWTAAWDAGRAMTAEQVVEHALEQESAPDPDAPETYPSGLSAREVGVLKLVAKGLTKAEAAEKPFLTSRTGAWPPGDVHRY